MVTRTRTEKSGGRQMAIAQFAVDDLLNPHNATSFKQELVNFINATRPETLIIDWANVMHAGTDSFGVLLALQRRLGEWKGTLRLCGMNPLLMDSFRQCGLNRILLHYDDLENARSAVVTGLKNASMNCPYRSRATLRSSGSSLRSTSRAIKRKARGK